MELRQLRYFVAVAERRHFTAAAQALHLAQPALSQQIRLLEREVGVELFDRSGHRVRLTAAGEAFLPRAQRVLVEVQAAAVELGEFAGLLRGRVVVGALPSLAEHQLPPLLADFHARYPGLELVIREENTTELLSLVRAGAIDLGFVHQLAAEPPPADILLEELFTEDLVAVFAPGHRLAGHDPVSLEVLRDYPLLCSKPGSALRQTVLQACMRLGITPQIRFESGGTASVRALAAAGLGVAILPRSDADAVGPSVAWSPLTPLLRRTVALALTANRYQPVAVRAFVTLAHELMPPAATSRPWREA
ncbi:MAG: LysR substrate-binding domain-containing protein [Dehalococcoidia bacterium]